MIRPAVHERLSLNARRLFSASANEVPALVAGVLLFLLLFAGYTMLRPIRETMGISSGVENLHWLFLGTFVATVLFVPVFGTLASRLARRVLLPASYVFAAATLIALGTAMRADPTNIWIGRFFYVWLSVLNLFLISVAWSVMCDVFNPDQARRLFGPIAAGASFGGLIGPIAASLLVVPAGHGGLLLIASALLLATIPLSTYLHRWRDRHPQQEGAADDPREPIGGHIFSGLTLVARSPYLLGVALMVLLLTSVSTFLYFEQARIVGAVLPDPARQTQLFGAIDALVQALTIGLQLFVTGRLAERMGVTALLTAVPLVMVLGFGLLAIVTAFPLLIGVVVLRRIGEYALARPGREMLFTRVSREARYKAKNAIDTAVYRGGDALSAWLKAGVDAIGAPAMLVGAAIAGLWAFVGFSLGQHYERRSGDTIRSKAVEVA